MSGTTTFHYSGGAGGGAGDGNTIGIGGSHDVIVPGTDIFSGTEGMSFITTGAGNGNTINAGGNGNTISVGGNGNTIGVGDNDNTINVGGNDNPFVQPAAGQGLDSITEFTDTNGDLLDLRSALAATSWNHRQSTLDNYLQVSSSGGDTSLSVAPTGSDAGTAIATLNGAGNLTLSDLLSHHALMT